MKGDNFKQTGRTEASEQAATLAVLEAKLAEAGGLQGVVEKLEAAGAAVAAVSESEINEMRGEIRALIDRLLGMHADLQELAVLRRGLD